MTEYGVAVVDNAAVVSIEISAMIASCQSPEQSCKIFRRSGLAAKPCHDRWRQLLQRRMGLGLIQVEAPA
jgi:hypothetical protein